MLYLLYALFFVACIVLIGSVLLQPGKTDAGALFTSNVSSAAFGPRGTASVLSKLTIGAAAVFMISALLISMPALSGTGSVLQSVSETPSQSTTEQPATVEPATAPPTADAAVNSNSGSNSGLIETPATSEFQADANANAAGSANK